MYNKLIVGNMFANYVYYTTLIQMVHAIKHKCSECETRVRNLQTQKNLLIQNIILVCFCLRFTTYLHRNWCKIMKIKFMMFVRCRV